MDRLNLSFSLHNSGNHLRRLLSLAAIIPLLSLAACDTSGSPDNGNGDDLASDGAAFGSDSDSSDAQWAGPENYDWDSVPDPQLAGDSVNLDDEPCFDSLEVSEDFTSTIIHLLCPASAVDIEAGDILVSSEGSGYLLRILSLEEGDYKFLAETRMGTLTELFPDGGFFATIPLDDLSRAPLVWGANTILDEDGLKLRFEGATIDLNSPELIIGHHHGGGFVLRRDMYLQMDSSISMNVSVTYNAATPLSKSKSFTLATYTFPIQVVTPAFIYVGTVELTAKIKISATVKAQVSLRTGATLDTTLRVGASYNEVEDRFEELENIEANFTANPTTVVTTKNITFKASIDLRASVKHYSILSTYVETGPYVKLSGDAECSELKWALTSGWGGKVGADVGILWLPESSTWNVNIITIPFNQPFGGPLAEGSIDLPISVGGEDCDDPPEPEPEPEPETDPEPEPETDPEPEPEPEPTTEGSGSCTPVQELTCGQRITGNTASDPEASSVLDAYSINVGNYSAPELVYRWNGSGPVRFRFIRPRPTQVNHDIMILDASGEGDSCSGSEGLDYGFNSVLWDGSGAVFVVIDGYNNDAGAFELEVDCSP